MSAILYNGMAQSIITKNDAMDLYKSWIYRCVDLRSKFLAGIEFQLYRMKKNGEVEEVLEHELLDLLYRVNPGTTQFDFMELSITYLDIFGASPWILKGGKRFKSPTAIYSARPEYMTIKRDRQGQAIGYVYQIGKTKIEYERDEVIFLKNYNPKDPDRGLGVIEAVRLTAQNEDYIQQHNNNLIKNGARPSGVLEVEGNIGEDYRKRLKKEIEDTYAGYQNTGRPMLLEGGMKWSQMGITPKDLDFVSSREMNRDEIAGIFGVPKSLLGFTDANRASAATSEYIFAKYTLEPLAKKYLAQMNEFLVPRFGDDLWLWFEPLAQRDEEMETNRKDKSWNRWKTTNEIRVEEGLDPVVGGDVIYMPMSNMPFMRDEGAGKKEMIQLAGKEVDSLKVDAKTAKWVKKHILNRNVRLKRQAEAIAEKASAKLIKKKKIVLKIVPEKKAMSAEAIEGFYKRRMADEAKLENLWEKTMLGFFEGQKDRFLKSVEETSKGLAEDYGINPQDELKSTIEIISPLVYETVKNGVMQASEAIGEPAVFDMDFIHQWIAKVSEETGTSINETTITAFEETMKEGIAAGESLGDLKNRVEEVFEFAKSTRATLIARTETARGVTEAHRKMYEHYGFEEVKWLLSPGACEECVARAGGSWTTKSIEGQIPVHPNCKCDFTPL